MNDAPVQRRPSWAYAVLMIVTFGIFWPVWYGLTNRRLRDLGRDRGAAPLAGSRPWRSIAAITLGNLLLIPPIVSVVGFAGRLQEGERAAGIAAGPTGVLVAVLVIGSVGSSVLVVGLAGPAVYAIAGAVLACRLVAMLLVQSRLNALADVLAAPRIA